MDQNFFDEQTQQSRIKAQIVIDYFLAWSRIMRNKWTGSIGYIDLYSGPGTYEDGTPSVPMLLVSEILKDEALTRRMQLIFNDANPENVDKLRNNLEGLNGFKKITDRVKLLNIVVGADTWQKIQIDKSVPVFSFIDPFGYKGLTMSLINRLIENNGSDCLFFFNYNRINMALSSNIYFDEHLAQLFGKEGTQDLKKALQGIPSDQREELVVHELAEKIKQNKARHVLCYRFYCKEMRRTSHYLIFVTKHELACKIMKGIMARKSYKDADGIATFELKDKTNFQCQSEQLSLFDRPFDDLCEKLRIKYSGKRVLIGDICNCVARDDTNQYIEKNVKDALRRLEADNFVEIEGRKKNSPTSNATMPDTAYAIFRERE